MHSKSQQGAALIIFLLILLIAGGLFLLLPNAPPNPAVEAENTTTSALSRAKRALIDYAVAYYYSADKHQGHHGFLPCPETPGSLHEGRSVLNCAAGASSYVNQLGRLPWKTLQVAPIMDASGECLWYAMSGSFSPSPRVEMLNDDTPGMFQLHQQNGDLLNGATTESRLVAVIIAPGPQLPGQSRSPANTDSPCRRYHDQLASTDYLETTHGISNSSVSSSIPDQVDSFITSQGFNSRSSLNDRMIGITSDEIFDAIKRNAPYYTDRIGQLGIELGNCLLMFAQPDCQCDNSCKDAFNLCDASARTVTDVAACVSERNACFNACRPVCASQPASPSVPGLSANRLPWPAPIDLASDYRNDDNYDDLANGANGYLGRLPYFIDDSAARLSRTDLKLFEQCQLETSTEFFHLWQNWKDHWFYVVGEDFSPTGTGAASCTHCPQVDGTRHAAVLLFSSGRLDNQLRRASETEASPPHTVESKANILNYLEGSNASAYPDTHGNAEYGIDNVNDRLFCISTDLSNVIECTP